LTAFKAPLEELLSKRDEAVNKYCTKIAENSGPAFGGHLNITAFLYIHLAPFSGSRPSFLCSNICANQGRRYAIPGYRCSEKTSDITAMSMAQFTGKPAQLIGAEHYDVNLHNKICTSVPIFTSDHRLAAISQGVEYNLQQMEKQAKLETDCPSIKNIEAVDTVEAAVRDSDVVCIATSSLVLVEDYTLIEEVWIKKGALKKYFVNQIIANDGKTRIGNLAKSSGYSDRYVNSMFTSEMGIAPKKFCRIIRFQKCLSDICSTYSSLALVGNNFIPKRQLRFVCDLHSVKFTQIRHCKFLHSRIH